jgi:succinate-acetate transporter protein
MWGSFWLAYGILYLLVANGSLAAGSIAPSFGWWFIPLAAITGVATIAALGRNLALSVALLFLALASAIAAIGLLVPSSSWFTVAGYFFMGAAVAAWYTASAMLLEDSFRRVVLPLGNPRLEANIPGRMATRRVEYQYGEPGVRAGL